MAHLDYEKKRKLIYLFLLVFSVANIYAVERITSKLDWRAFLFGIFPALFVLIIVPSLQYGVGADYFSYREIYNGEHHELDRFYRRGEYLFYYIFQAIISLDLGSQAIFAVSSTFNMVALFFVFCVLRSYGYKVWVLLLIFFVVTNIYHNQMNGIRQYMALLLIPVMFVALVERKFYLYAALVISASLFHQTSIVSFLLIPIMFFCKLNKKLLFLIFLVSPIFLLLLKPMIVYFVENYLIAYSHYLESSYGEGLGLTSILSKLYYFPVFLLFWLLYLKDKSSVNLKGIDFGIVIWTFTYWLFILYLDFGFLYRLSSYFFFFYIFPLYFVWEYFFKHSRVAYIVMFFSYLLLPYLFKVIILSKGVFTYKSIF